MEEDSEDEYMKTKILDIVRDVCRIHEEPCFTSDIHMIVGDEITKLDVKYYLERLVETERDIIKIGEDEYFYEGKEYISEF